MQNKRKVTKDITNLLMNLQVKLEKYLGKEAEDFKKMEDIDKKC